MPARRRVAQKEPEPVQEPSEYSESDLSQSEPEEPQQPPPLRGVYTAEPDPAKPRRGGDIQKARQAALQKLQEKRAEKQAKEELEREKKELERELLEAERAAVKRQLEEARRLKEQAASKPRKKAPPPSDSESEEDTPPLLSDGEYIRHSRTTPKPRRAKAEAAQPKASHDQVIQAEYQRRLEAIRKSLYDQIFS